MANPRRSGEIFISKSTRLRLDLAERLEEHSKESGKSITSIINEAIEEYLLKLDCHRPN